jgi:hypothetical protein
VPAILTAEAHNGLGMREGILRVRRQRSNRRWTFSSSPGSARAFLVLIGRPPQVHVLTAHDTTPLKTLHTRPPEEHEMMTFNFACTT